MEKERRFISLDGIEVRESEGGVMRGIKGVAAVYDTGTVIGGMFEERIAPGAFDDAMKDGDVRGLFNHDPNFPLGRTSAGTMTLTSSKEGLDYDIPVLPAARNDVLEAIQRGDVTGNSFSFSIDSDVDEEWTDRAEEKMLPLRVIKRVGKLYDVGPVTFPAYDETTVSARCAEKCEPKKPEPKFDHLHRARKRRLKLAE